MGDPAGDTGGTPEGSGEGCSGEAGRQWQRRLVLGTEEGNIHVVTVTQRIVTEPSIVLGPSRVTGAAGADAPRLRDRHVRQKHHQKQ